MELQEQFITDNNLSTEQVTAINGVYANNVAELKKEWDGVANKNAEGILQGAASYAQKSSGLELTRNEGEKFGDFLGRLGDASISKRSEDIGKREKEYQEKVKNFKGNEAIVSEFEAYKLANDPFKQKAAKFDELVLGDYKNKFDNSSKELAELKRNMSFNAAKPNFPDSVNKYEAKEKWNEFIAGVDAKYDFHLDENQNPILRDKENEYKIVSLSDLVKEDKNISDLLTNQKTPGLSTKPSNTSVEGVPFKVSDNMTPGERSFRIKEYLTNDKKLSFTSPEYSNEFKRINALLMGKTPV